MNYLIVKKHSFNIKVIFIERLLINHIVYIYCVGLSDFDTKNIRDMNIIFAFDYNLADINNKNFITQKCLWIMKT